MPERVTREERTVSLAIEKARSAKEELLASLNDNNRSDLEKDNIMDKVKVTRPKAEKDKSKKYSEGKHSGFGLGQNKTAGQVTEFKKGNLREQAKDMKKPMNLREQAKNMKRPQTLAEQAKEFKKSLDILKETIRGQGARTGNPVLDREKEEEIEELIEQVSKDMKDLLEDFKAGRINQKDYQEKMQDLIRETNLEEILSGPTQRFR